MARGKKKESALTPEEKLAQALVPDWEQPYKVPANWCWTQLRYLVSHTSGNSKLIKGKLPSKHSDGLFPAFSASGQDVFYENFEHEGNAIIVSAVGARCGKAFVAQGKWSAIANTHCVFPNENVIDLKFLYYLINDEEWWIKSGSAQPFVSVKASFERPFGLPPIVEQQRIVDRIEYLFAKLDEAKEKAQSVLDSFETRKAAILYKAITGDLTAEWELRNPQLATGWKECELLDVLIEKPRNGYSPKPVDYVTRYKSMTLSATTSGYFRPEFFKYIDEEIPDDSQLWLKPGDILMQRANSLEKVGTSALYTGKEHEFVYPDLMMKLQVKNGVSAPFVAYCLKSDSALLYLRSNATGTAGNMPKINQKVVSALPIRIPSLPEQEEIVRILDSIFAKEQQAKEAAEVVLEKIDLLKKSILARAFRGELGTNDPSEESALELLKSVL